MFDLVKAYVSVCLLIDLLKLFIAPVNRAFLQLLDLKKTDAYNTKRL